MKKYDKFKSLIGMQEWENAKNMFWKLPLPEHKKQQIYNFLRVMARGKVNGAKEHSIFQTYIDELLEKQNLNNSFSVDYPTKPLVTLIDDDPKLIAYYLPQYYPDEHNTKWWGRGSTEWTNVGKTFPQYIGQYQPRFPGELGYYDLRIMDNIYRQIELAKIYGIYGFCFYYYWFDGERLLGLPFNNFINDKTIDFPFSICWVNESWTKQWSGTSATPLIVQSDTVESYKAFIKSCTQIFTKKNYIKVNNKPVLTVYHPLAVPNPDEVLTYWREYSKKEIGVDLYIIAVVSSKLDYMNNYEKLGFDACSEFALGPQRDVMQDITETKQFVCDVFRGHVYDYAGFVKDKGYFTLKRDNCYRAISPMWDNTSRRKNNSTVFDGATPQLYKQWLIDIIKETKANQTIVDKFIFINAWNEWAEGAYLEPDLKWQYGYLEATKNAILESR